MLKIFFTIGIVLLPNGNKIYTYQSTIPETEETCVADIPRMEGFLREQAVKLFWPVLGPRAVELRVLVGCEERPVGVPG